MPQVGTERGRVAVAGAAGFIGSHVVEQLVASGAEVVALDRSGADLGWAERAGVTVHHADLSDERAARELLAGCERVINATGLFALDASQAELQRVNVELTRALARASKGARVRRFVQLSSVAVYGVPAYRPMGELGPFAPRSAYERSKWAGEQAALAEHDGARSSDDGAKSSDDGARSSDDGVKSSDGFEVTVLRPTLVYGPRSRYGHAVMLALAAQARALGVRRLPLFEGGAESHHVHVEDVARAAELLAYHPAAAGRCFNIADEHPLPTGQVIATIARAYGYRPIDGVAAKLAWRVARPLFDRVRQAWLDALNARLARGSRLLRARGQKIEIVPRLDAEWLRYLSGEYVFDTTRIKSLGFVLRHPDFRDSIAGVIDWYRRHEWLPAVATGCSAARTAARA